MPAWSGETGMGLPFELDVVEVEGRAVRVVSCRCGPSEGADHAVQVGAGQVDGVLLPAGGEVDGDGVLARGVAVTAGDPIGKEPDHLAIGLSAGIRRREGTGRSGSKLFNRGTDGFVCRGGPLVEAQQRGLVLDRGERDQGVIGGTAEDLSGGYGGQKLLVSGF